MTVGAMVEVGIALAMLVGGAVAYRRGSTQGPVLLFLVAAINLNHGLGCMEYRHTAGEGATYALRIGGMMLTAFGLVLVLFVAAFTATPGGAR
jgi:hypothetical protein